MNYKNDNRIVLTLDAGGTNFVFSAISGNKEIVEPLIYPSSGEDLEKCLSTIIRGFREVKSKLKIEPAAISFSFPGPADYPAGIIGDLWNLPGFKGGIPLGPMLENIFSIPVFINNDGNLFVYGEAIAGFLPYLNGLLEETGSRKKFKNLFGVTLGTGFGGGFVHDRKLLVGENSCGGEIWLLNHGFEKDRNVEESLSIRGLKNVYSVKAGIDPEKSPEPSEIYKIARGEIAGDKEAAVNAFINFGKILGNTLSNVVTLFDSLVVIGGGLCGASNIFLNEVVAEMNGIFFSGGKNIKKMEVTAFNLENKKEMDKFLKGEKREINIPFSDRKILYDPLQRVGVGISRLGTSKAVSIGAYSFALSEIDGKT